MTENNTKNVILSQAGKLSYFLFKISNRQAFILFQVIDVTAITLTPPTVGRRSADLSADKMPDFSSFFIGRQK